MNKTFHIVFNQARGALMVVNEATHTVHKAGRRTAVAVAVCAAAGVAVAAPVGAASGIYAITADVNANVSHADGQLSDGPLDNGQSKIENVAIAALNGHTVTWDAPKNIVIRMDEEKATWQQKGVTATGQNSRIILGSDETESIVITSNNTTGGVALPASYTVDMGLTAGGVKTGTKYYGGLIEVRGKLLTVAMNATQEQTYIYGIHVGNNSTNLTEAEQQAQAAHVVVNADKTVIRATSKTAESAYGLVAMSQGIIDINGDLDVQADNIIGTRGGAITRINQQGKNRTVVLNGNLEFAYHSVTSGTAIDAKVLIDLTNAASYWTGRTNTSSDVTPIPAGKDAVTGFRLGLSNGGTWNATGDSFVNSLTFRDGGRLNVQAEKAVVQVGTGVVTGLGNTITVAKDGSVQVRSLTLSDKSELSVQGRLVAATADSIRSLGTLTLNDLSRLHVDAVTLGSTGVLKTSLTQAFNGATGFDTATAVHQVFSTDSKGVLSITDTGVYTIEQLKTMAGAVQLDANQVSLVLENATLAPSEAKAELVSGAIQASQAVQLDAVDGAVTIDQANTGAAQLTVADNAQINVSQGLTLVGTEKGGALAGNGTKLAVTHGNLNLGLEGVSPTAGTLATVELGADAKLNVSNGQFAVDKIQVGLDRTELNVKSGTLTADAVTGNLNMEIYVGTPGSAGQLILKRASFNGARIVLDPDWLGGGLDTIEKGSLTAIEDYGQSLSAYVNVSTNALLALGTSDSATAYGAFHRLAAKTPSLHWGEDGITVALYLNKTLQLGTTDFVQVDGSPIQTTAAGLPGVSLASGALLMINQAGIGAAAIEGDLVTADGSTIGVVNATAGSFDLAIGGTIDAGTTVLTDNLFVTGTISGLRLTNRTDTAGLQSAVQSMGLQAVTRRADAVFAQSIEQRLGTDQPAAEGLGLWAQVAGERYEADGYAQGGAFTSDMGYGAFGADIALSAGMRVGAALQYGSGSVRSANYGLKNSVTNTAAALYGAYDAGAVRLTAQLAYALGDNDVTGSSQVLSHSVDTSMLSAQLGAQRRFEAGAWAITPSVGVRVSQLRTDAQRVGALVLDKQRQSIVQVPISLQLGAADLGGDGWRVTPTVRLSYVPTFGDKDVSVLGVDTTVLDTSPVQAQLGLNARYGSFNARADLQLGGGKNGTSSVGGRIAVQYTF